MIEVKSPGMFTTVQDLGRPGYGHLGVSASGAADALALRIGNRLVENAESCAGLEMTLMGGAFVFAQDAVVAITGSDFGPKLDGQPVPLWSAFAVAAGQTVACGSTRSGARCYLCVRGGIAVPLFLGSASTHVLSGLGGVQGRALRKGDTLTVAQTVLLTAPKILNVNILRIIEPRKTLRVTSGPQAEWFPAAARNAFYSEAYRVTEESNRMGLRLHGPPVDSGMKGQMITEAVSLGAIQVPSAGQPIILFVEQQTTGGYPKIANVIAADLSSVGQLRPRDEVRFELVTPAVAHRLFCEQEELLQSDDLFQIL